MKSFLNACGFREPLQFAIEGLRGVEVERRSLSQPFAVIGRDARADIALDDPAVSRRHVYVQAVAGRVFWVDLESRTGTFSESGKRDWGWLPTGKGRLRIGPFTIRRPVNETTAADPGLGPSALDSPMAVRSFGRPMPEVSLEFLNGPSRATTWPMNRVMSLMGSARGCKFRLTDPSVSPFHAGLIRTPNGLWVVGLRGDRSIRINAEPMRSGPLADGDELKVGRYRMKIRCRMPAGETAGLPARRPSGSSSIAVSTPPPTGALISMPSSTAPVVASAAGISHASEASPPGSFHPEVHESVLVPLVNQFGMMQQQMFDQFQQAMGMLVQMFTSMHSEQMAVIREELDRLHELTKELQDLKQELARTTGEDTSTAPAPAPSPAASPSPKFPTAPIPTPPPRSSVVPPSVNAPPSSTGQPAEPESARAPSAAPSFPPSSSPPPSSPPSPPPPVGPRPDERPPGIDSPQDAVTWIHQRIASIQQERETRWQKILKILPGMS